METPHVLTLEEIKKEYPEQYLQALEKYHSDAQAAIEAVKEENERLTESLRNCQREYLLIRDTARQFETALSASREEVGRLTDGLKTTIIQCDNFDGYEQIRVAASEALKGEESKRSR